ncbi:MAG: putative toxin-antitoxin system toxin component, PIN family [Oscillospiraceae bacterium]|nr:putative toxin-antitoxin system toxin component, PIN family [Oscillospiraceae bacterium]
MFVVLDTNVLVSALWSQGSKPSAIVSATLAGRFKMCYDYRLLEEYRSVLSRPKFGFDKWQVDWLLEELTLSGISVIAKPLPNVKFTDESDRKFYEVAKFCNATLVTGNIKHCPEDKCISTVADFYNSFFTT